MKPTKRLPPDDGQGDGAHRLPQNTELQLLHEQVMAGTVHARAAVQPRTFDAENLTVDVVMGSGVEVLRVPWIGEPYLEELSMDPAHIRLGRMESGRMPLLDSHQRYSLDAQVGVVRAGRLEGRDLVASVQFSRRPQVAGIVQDVRDGIVGNLSLGYRVHRYQDVTLPTDTMRRLRAVDWEPMECSLVTVPADPGSSVRGVLSLSESAAGASVERAGDALTLCTIQGRQAEPDTMTPEQLAALEAARAASQPAGQPTTPNTTPAATAPAAPAAPAATSEDALREAQERARSTERERATEVVRLQGLHNLPAAWATRVMGNGALDLAGIRMAALEELAQRSNATHATTAVTMGQDAGDKLRSAVEGALLVRMGVEREAPTPEARSLGRRGVRGLAEVFFEGIGVRVHDLTPTEFANLALKGSTGSSRDPSRGLMSTSDFSHLLANVQNKAMRKRYEATPQSWLAIARRSEAPDFKPMKRIQLSGGTQLKTVNEHGEFERGSLADSSETYSLKTQGLIFVFTRAAFLNDDLGELMRVTERMGARAADRRTDLVISLITANAALGDGVAWFHATHGNLATGAPSALSETSLQTMLSAMRVQKDLSGNLLNIRPAILMVPAALEVAARKLTTQVTPQQSSNVNVFQGMFEQVIVEPRLDAPVGGTTAWFAFASPNQVDVIEYAELSGQSGPQIMVRNGFDVDGVEYRVHDDFGAAPLEYVSAYKAAGA